MGIEGLTSSSVAEVLVRVNEEGGHTVLYCKLRGRVGSVALTRLLDTDSLGAVDFTFVVLDGSWVLVQNPSGDLNVDDRG